LTPEKIASCSTELRYVFARMFRFWLVARVVILFSLALIGLGAAAFRPELSLAERGADALLACVVLFFAIRAERLRRNVLGRARPS
jgi:hypothetical protein